MFQVYNTSPTEISIDLDGKRVKFAPGETKGKWDTGGYIGPEDAEYMTSERKWGMRGLVLRGDDEKQGDARARGQAQFVKHVHNTVRHWLAANSELVSKRKPPRPIARQSNLKELVEMAEAISTAPGYTGKDRVTMSGVLEEYHGIVGGVIMVQGQQAPSGNGADTKKLIELITQMQGKLTEMSDRQQLLEEENDALRARIDKGASVAPDPDSLEEVNTEA